jgi:drug/metabolite transporter (DMT)-like permease
VLRFYLVMVAIGASNALSDVLFAVASQRGNLAVVAVLSGLFPVFTVLLAFIVLRQRATVVQVISAAAVLAGVAVFTVA